MGCPLGPSEPKIETDLRYCLHVNPIGSSRLVRNERKRPDGINNDHSWSSGQEAAEVQCVIEQISCT